MKERFGRADCALLLGIVLLGFAVRMAAIAMPLAGDEARAACTAEDGGPYLSEMDSYYYLRLTRQMAEEGRPFAVNARLSDPLMGSRRAEDTGGRGEPMLLPLVTWAIWRALSAFFPLTPLALARWLAPLLASLAAVPAYLYVRRRTNRAGAERDRRTVVSAKAGYRVPICRETVLPSGVFSETAPGRKVLRAIPSLPCTTERSGSSAVPAEAMHAQQP